MQRYLSVQPSPLPGPTPEVARIEALRELKASSQAVNIRLNGLRRTQEGDPLHNAFFVNLQRTIMARPEDIERLAPALHRQAEEAALAPATISNGPAQLGRFNRAVDYAAQLFNIPRQQTLIAAALDKLANVAPQPEPPVEPVKQKAPAPKRRGPKL